MTITVTETGGKVISMFSDRRPATASIAKEDARQNAMRFLEHHGYEDMVEVSHMLVGGVMIISYVWQQEGVLIYPDMIKLTVALDTGSVTGFEGRAYFDSHHIRSIVGGSITIEEAELTLPEGLIVESRSTVIIASEGEEKLCYEYLCSAGDNRCLIYIDALTGRQVDIRILSEDENSPQRII
jgi:germination protein YpeB